jgi:hypothetical protein
LRGERVARNMQEHEIVDSREERVIALAAGERGQDRLERGEHAGGREERVAAPRLLELLVEFFAPPLEPLRRRTGDHARQVSQRR